MKREILGYCFLLQMKKGVIEDYDLLTISCQWNAMEFMHCVYASHLIDDLCSYDIHVLVCVRPRLEVE